MIKTLKKLLAVALVAVLLPLPSPAQTIAAIKVPASVTAAPVAGAAIVSPLNVSASLPATVLPSAAFGAPILGAVPAAAVPVQALPVLRSVSASISAASSDETGRTLTNSYDGALTGVASSEIAPVAGVTPTALPSLARSAAAERVTRAVVTAAARKNQSGAAVSKGTILGIVAGVITIGALIFVLARNGSEKNKIWEQSPASKQVVQIDQARAAGDATTLFKIEAEARARQKTTQDADAKKAKTLDAFDGVVALRGGVNGNAVSSKPSERPGAQLPSTWKDRLTTDEAAARRSGDISRLARTLADLRAELAKENAAAGIYSEDLRKFQAEVPTFGGAMGAQADKASKDLNEFRAEAETEQALHDQYAAALRAIVSERLAATNPAFRGELERADRLARIASGALSTLDDQADKVDRDLKEMAAQRRAQRDNLAEADKHTADPGLAPNGDPIITDNSQDWKDKAAQNAANAQAAAASAKANIEAFNRDLASLRRDAALQEEGLDKSLPRSARVGQPDWQNGINRDLLEPWQLEDAARNFTEAEANDARARFGTAKGAVDAVQSAVKTRKNEVKQRVDEAVDAEIARQTKNW